MGAGVAAMLVSAMDEAAYERMPWVRGELGSHESVALQGEPIWLRNPTLFTRFRNQIGSRSAPRCR